MLRDSHGHLHGWHGQAMYVSDVLREAGTHRGVYARPCAGWPTKSSLRTGSDASVRYHGGSSVRGSRGLSVEPRSGGRLVAHGVSRGKGDPCDESPGRGGTLPRLLRVLETFALAIRLGRTSPPACLGSATPGVSQRTLCRPYRASVEGGRQTTGSVRPAWSETNLDAHRDPWL